MNKLNAQDGMWLTQITCDESQRVFLKHITGIQATHEYWRNATEVEKLEWEEAHKPEEPQEEVEQ